MSNPESFFPHQPAAHNPFNQPQARSGCSCLTMGLVLFLGGGLLLALLCCGVGAYFSVPPKPSAAASEPFAFENVPVPNFPNVVAPVETAPGVVKHEITLGESDGYYGTPGHGGKLVVYLPAGRHKARSLPCILITGAGSDLLSGMLLGDGDSPEHVPYAQAGYAVVAYELDGPADDSGNPAAMRRAYEAFQAARAGLVNARNALEFAVGHLPEVDPNKVYAAGHSSAATHALLFAEHEPRLAGVIAYAPAVNVPKRFGPMLRVFAIQLPGVADFAQQSSPHTHVSRLKCPTFLFHAEDDTNCPIAETREFEGQLKQQGTDATLVTVATGGHYQSMIDEGIPAAIKWLREQEKKRIP